MTTKKKPVAEVTDLSVVKWRGCKFHKLTESTNAGIPGALCIENTVSGSERIPVFFIPANEID